MSGRFIDAVALGPRRRRRQMAKRLAALDRLDREAALRLPPLRKQHRLRAFVTLIVFALAVTGVVLVARRSSGNHPPAAENAFSAGNDSTNNGATTTRKSGAIGGGPTSGVGERLSRLLPAPAAPAGTGGYKLLKTGPGVPARYDPCRPIHYVIRDQNTPAGGDDAIRLAVAAVSKATGLRFVEDGTTTETPSMKRPAYLPVRYGDRWAPVLIAWTNPTEIPDLKGDTAGLGGSWAYSANTGHGSAYVSGHVYLDTAELVSLQANTHGDVTEKVVIEHELGHLVGLDHVTDPTQVMYPSSHGMSGYGAGDLRGLAIAGSGSCHPEL
jgi:Matrixin